MAITAQQVKELRESTGAGMMDAKKALTETDGDMEAAVDWLRTKGLAKAAKKSGRTAAEGLVARRRRGRQGRRRRGELRNRLRRQERRLPDARRARSPTPRSARRRRRGAEGGRRSTARPVEDVITDAIATIGENMTAAPHGRGRGRHRGRAYVHNAAADGMGKIGVLVALKGGDDEHRPAGRDAHRRRPTRPSLCEADLDPAVVEKEKQVQTGHRPRNAASPKPVIEKMIDGRMKKFLAEVTLLGQKFVMNPDLTVGAGRRRKPASRSPASSGWQWAKGSRRRKKISPPKSPRSARG